jgi:hypothetical protein
VQSFLGHSDSETTEQYIDLAFRVVREGVAKFSERLADVFNAEENATKLEILLHFDSDTVTITKERYYRLLEIESQYNAQQEETRRLHRLLEEVIHQFEDNPKIIHLREYFYKRSA